jgi:putative ABC transport system permease protein
MTRRFHSDRPDVGDLPIREDVDKEVHFHLEMRTQELIDEGWEPAAAGEEARRLFGQVDEVRGEMGGITRSSDRAVYRARFFDALFQDLKYAWRTLSRAPTFTLVAVLTLALGIGANTAIFSVVNGVLFRPLPYPDADRLVQVMERNDSRLRMDVAWPNFVDWREQARSLDGAAAFTAERITVLGPDRAVRTRGSRVSQGFFELLGVNPMLGRTFTTEEHVPGAAPSALISHRFWQDELGGGTDLSSLRVSAGAFTFQVVGVMPPTFGFPEEAELWYPVELQIWGLESRTSHNYDVLARLTNGVTIEAARDELAALTRRVNAAESGDFAANSADVAGLQANLTGDVRRPLMLLLGAALLVLLIACSNLASTFLARAQGREREIAVRASLGAARGRIVRQLFTEALLLTGIGMVAGLLLATGLIKGLVAVARTSVPLLDAVRIDGTVLAFTLLASALTAILFGLLPGLQASRRDVGTVLRGGDRGSSGPMRRRAWRFLVASEVALALVLLVGSGLLLSSFGRILAVEAGFDPTGVVSVSLELPETRYDGDPKMIAYYDQALTRFAAIPGVLEVGVAGSVPLSGGFANGQVGIDGGVNLRASGIYQVASGGYFRALNIPLLQGRLFSEDDDASVGDVAIISESFAELAWPGQDPLGKRMNGGGMDNYLDPEVPEDAEWYLKNRWATVIGVVGDVRQRNLTDEPRPTYYFHYKQRPARARFGAVVVKAIAGQPALVSNLRATTREMDAMVAAEFSLLDGLFAQSVADRRFTMMVLAAFAGLALLLSTLGIYGVVSYSVARRTREMGIRLALGAAPVSVRQLVQRGALGTVLLGAAVGIVGCVVVARLMSSLLFDVSPTDALTVLAATGMLLGAAWLASFVPALRTSRIDPMLTMRAE